MNKHCQKCRCRQYEINQGIRNCNEHKSGNTEKQGQKHSDVSAPSIIQICYEQSPGSYVYEKEKLREKHKVLTGFALFATYKIDVQRCHDRHSIADQIGYVVFQLIEMIYDHIQGEENLSTDDRQGDERHYWPVCFGEGTLCQAWAFFFHLDFPVFQLCQIVHVSSTIN